MGFLTRHWTLITGLEPKTACKIKNNCYNGNETVGEKKKQDDQSKIRLSNLNFLLTTIDHNKKKNQSIKAIVSFVIKFQSLQNRRADH